MLVHKTKKIVSCNDFELGIKRDTSLEYRVSYPSAEKAKAIVFIIPGFGADTNSDYMDKLREYVANTFSVVAVNVFYHCFYSRPENGATLAFDDLDIYYLKKVIEEFNIDFSDVEEINKESVLKKLHSLNRDITISMTLIPKNDEYQNFGLMQAVDHLNVLKDLHKTLEGSQNLPVVCFGSSHGGYIAHIMAKIAPATISHVVDNSSYVKAPLQYVVGKESDVNTPEFFLHEGKLRVHCFVQSYWTTDSSSPYYFSQDRSLMRDISNLQHIKVCAKDVKNKTNYSIYHSVEDSIAPVEDKKLLCKNLEESGYSVAFHLFSKMEEIDGKLIKNLQHGMSMSIKELIKRELPQILEKSMCSMGEKHSVEYLCDTVTYAFDFTKNLYECRVV